MKKLDKFILKSFMGPFLAVLFIVIFILMMQFLWLYIDELVGKGLSLRIIGEFLFWGSITSMYLSIPLAILLGTVMTMGAMGENNELLAMKSAGISITRIMVPLTAVILVVCVGTFYLCNTLVPIAYNKIFTLRDDIGRTKDEIKIPVGAFYDGIEGYVLRIDDRDDETGMMHGIIVYNHSGYNGNTNVTLADSAKITMSEDKSYMKFQLFSGVNYDEDNMMKYRDTTLKMQRTDFLAQTLIIPLENYSFEKSDTVRFSDEVKTMRNEQLRIQKDSLNYMNDALHKSHYIGMIEDRAFQHGLQLDTSKKARAHVPFECDSLLKWDNLESEIAAYRSASSSTNDVISTLSAFSRDTYHNNYILRRTDVGILDKYATALACIIMFFIGGPIGATVRKKGLGVPAIIAALFFVLYWVVNISGVKLAKDGATSAFVGVFFSAFVLAPLGAFMTYKAINDSSIINTEKFKTFFKKISRMITGQMKKTKIVYMGTPEFAVAPLDALVKAGYNIAGVVTTPDKASGRGLKVNESAVKKYAVEQGIPLLQPEKLKDPEFLRTLGEWNPDLIVVVAFRMLPKEVWSMPRLGTFNLHAALLPQYRGAAPINWAIINGERMSGVTTFMIDENIDTGNVIYREQCKIEDTDTAGDLHDKLMALGTELVVGTVDDIFDRTIELRLQKSFIQGAEVLKPAPKLTKELCHIDWNRSTEDVYNLIRGLSPYPTAYTNLVKDGTETSLKIFFGERMPLEKPAEPGSVLSDGKTYFAIATSDGAISVKDLQIAGKKRMQVDAFLLGFRDAEKYKAS